MFGFLRPGKATLEYRQAYARCCSFQHRCYGISSLPWLSYEGVFLYLCGVDAGLSPGPLPSAPRCCKLRMSSAGCAEGDAALARFCVSLGLLLADVKLHDDVRDDGSWLARFARWRFGRQFRLARQYFAGIDKRFVGQIDSFLAAHENLERSARHPSIEKYAEPTAEAFGYMFGLLCTAAGKENCRDVLTHLGRSLGAAIIAFDAAVDFRVDRRRGRYNPLEDEAQVSMALQWSALRLVEAGWLSANRWGGDCQPVQVLQAAFDRVVARGENRTDATAAVSVPRRARLLLARAGFCDCDCPGCDCPGCDAPGCDWDMPCHGLACSGCDLCCCDPCPPYGKERSTTRQKGEGETPGSSEASESLVNQEGRAVSSLRPSGIVDVAGKRLPAQTEGEWIDTGTDVVVVKQSRFGVVVRPK